MSENQDIHARSNAMINRHLAKFKTYEISLPVEAWQALPRLLMAYNPALAERVNGQIIRQMLDKGQS